MATYQQMSQQVFSGNFTRTFYFQPFYYAAFMPLVYMFFGKGIWEILAAQAILGTLTIWLTGYSAALIRNRKAGIISALLMTFSLMAIFYSAYLLIVTLKTFLIALLIFLAIKAWKKDKWQYWIYLGVVSSCLTLTRANAIVFLPLLMIYAYFVKRKNSSSPPNAPMMNFLKKISPALVVLLIFILVTVPFIYHNSKIEGKLTMPSTAGSANLAIGNNPEACPAGLSYTQTSAYWSAHSEQISIPSRIMLWFKDYPLSFLELTFRKLMVFWDAGTIFDNITDFNKSRSQSVLLTYFPFIPTSLFLIGFLAFCSINAKKIFSHKKTLLLFMMVLLYWLTVAGFIHLSRYRLAILPALAIFAAFFIEKIINDSTKANKLIKPIAAFLIATAFVYGAYPLYRYHLEGPIIGFIQPSGVKVKLGTYQVYIDNGPRNMGSWKTFPLVPGNAIIKQFAIDAQDIGRKAEFHLKLICDNAPPMQININGQPFTSIPAKKQMVFKFKIKVPQDGKIIIEPKILKPGTVFAYCDLQRNYSRTAVNNAPLNGELVCRLIVDRSPK